MRLVNPFTDLPLGAFFDTLLPDFLLAFTFFTALIYSVLGRRFGRERPAVAMYGVLGLTLAIGLVWLEHDRGWSVRNLGPIALGFAILLLGMMMYRAIRQVGGSWAGAGIALGGCLLVAWVIGFDWPVPGEIVQTIMTVALVVGIIGFLIHSRSSHPLPAFSGPRWQNIRHDMTDLYRSRQVGEGVRRGLRKLRREAVHLPEQPNHAPDVMRQLNRMLPAEGWLTQEFVRLKERAHAMRTGDLKNIEALQHVTKKLPREARRGIKEELASRCKALGLDTRLERLDKVVAENERRITLLTRDARNALARYDYRKLTDLLREAEKLQKHNGSLLRVIDRTDQKMVRMAETLAKEAGR